MYNVIISLKINFDKIFLWTPALSNKSSRSVTPSELKNSDLWWHGPHWLFQIGVSRSVLKNNVNYNQDSELLEQIKQHTYSSYWIFNLELLNYIRLLRIMAYILRFIAHIRTRKEKWMSMMFPYKTYCTTNG